MLGPQHLTTLLASTARYRDTFTSLLQFTVPHALGFQSSLVVSWKWIFNSLTVTSNHSLNPFLSLFCNCQFRKLVSIQFISRQAAVPKLDSLPFSSTLCCRTLLYNNFAQPVYCWEGMITALLHSNGSYSIVASVFVTV
jgi:hypothetical protein